MNNDDFFEKMLVDYPDLLKVSICGKSSVSAVNIPILC